MFPLRDTQPSYSKPVVTVFIILLNLAVFVYELTLSPYQTDRFVALWGLVPDRFSLLNVFTSMFVHGGFMHVAGNMWFLWIFGDNIEDTLGHAKYLLFYLLCGVAAAFSQVVINPYSTIPMVGASGAIAGVMGAYLIKFPGSRIRTLVFYFLITFLDVPAWLMLIYWFGIQFLSGVGSLGATTQASQGGTAFFAHIGGFLVGMVLIKIMPTQNRNVRRRDDYSW